ncbi:Signal transduction histidine kinase [Nannocystis exedens]|uniref:histidine kinase n=1 Tax=Nannocystis exedens TaxID=54 RepID=A0A1I2AK48_9BACT|nr:ATP-binding protein [Nannocystis exedens]PCC69836.1 hybrid sensor histidine kinase/response regulator [Nannocystis exedens]SFE43240.1 Signal transduction histidine kinase [Nannocystis exedens]
MGIDREHERRVALARGILAWLTACGGVLIVAEVALLPVRHAWQHLAGLGLASLFVVTCGLGLRRARVDPGRALEHGYVAILVALAGTGLLVALPLLVLACAAAFLILATAPRVVAPARVDLWTVVAVFGALALGALELAPLPTRALDTPGGPLRDLACVGALLVAGVLAVRGFSRYSLKVKLTLVTLLVALAPLFVVRVDAHLRLAASDLEAALSDMSDRAARSAGAWDGFLAAQQASLRALAGEDEARAACAGAADPREALALQLRRWTGSPDSPVRAAGLWGAVGQRVLGLGEFPLAAPPPAAVAFAVDGEGRDVLVLAAPVDGECVLAVALRPGLVQEWSAEVAAATGVAVVLRDREDRLLFGPGDLAAVVPGYPALPPVATAGHKLPLPRAATEDTAVARLGDGRLAAVARIAGADWTLALVRDAADLDAVTAEHARRVQWITLLVAALASLGAFALSRRLAAPIARLATAMAHFTGDDPRATSRGGDELDALARRFELMADQVGALLRAQEQQTRRLQAEVAERSEQERRLQALNRELSAASDLAQAASRAKSTFLAHMSHELRTPLSAIIGYGEMLHEQAREHGHDGYARDADNIVQAAQHLLTIINELLDLSKIEAGKMDMVLEEFDAAKLAREVVDTVRPLVAANRNKLALQIDQDPAPMYSDRHKLRQVLLNLLGNAAKFTEDGEIVLSLGQRSAENIICLVFTVRDTGRGIAESALATLFEPFTQVVDPSARRTTGTGLGLAITRRFCRLMGGEVEVTSTPGVGSTFTVTVPVSYRGVRDSGSWRPRKTPLRMDETARIEL